MDINQYLNPETIVTLQAGGYFLMLGLMIIEGPLVTLAAALLASFGIFDFWIVLVLGWLGDILGDFLFYSIGRYGLHIFTKKTTIDTSKEATFIHKLDHLIHTNLALAILIIKFTPYASPIGLTYIGKIHVNLKKYLLVSIFLCVPIPLASALIGFHLGYINAILSKYSGIGLLAALSVSIFIIFMTAGFFLYLKKKSETVLNQEEDIILKKIVKKPKADGKVSK